MEFKNKYIKYWVFIVFLMVMTTGANVVFAYEIPQRPAPQRLVNDFAEVLDYDQEMALESKLVRYNDSTSTQIAVVTIKTLDGANIAEYAFKLGRIWGIGQKGKDNGIVIIVCPEERQSFIATGYGVEGFVTDMSAGQIVSQVMIPFFKEGKYYEGVDAAADNLFLRLTGAYKADPKDNSGGSLPWWAVVLLVILFVWIFTKLMRGGGSGITYTPHGTRTHWGSTPFMGGGFGGGGFGGGSSGGGGGFGGFGGGSFGGGGAGGSW